MKKIIVYVSVFVFLFGMVAQVGADSKKGPVTKPGVSHKKIQPRSTTTEHSFIRKAPNKK